MYYSGLAVSGALTTCWSGGINNTPVFPFCSDYNVPAAGFSSDEHAEGQSDGIFPLLPHLIPLSFSAARHSQIACSHVGIFFWGGGGMNTANELWNHWDNENRGRRWCYWWAQHESTILCRAKSSINMSRDNVDQASSSPKGGEKSQNIKTSIKRFFLWCVSVHVLKFQTFKHKPS